MATASCITASEIAAILDRPVVRVRHILASRNIEPIARAGLVRVYDAAAIEKVRAELGAIEKRQGKVPDT
jgi:hypothetical protein